MRTRIVPLSRLVRAVLGCDLAQLRYHQLYRRRQVDVATADDPSLAPELKQVVIDGDDAVRLGHRVQDLRGGQAEAVRGAQGGELEGERVGFERKDGLRQPGLREHSR